MPDPLSTASITLPKDVAATVATKVSDASAIAKLSTRQPMIFADHGFVVFDSGAEAEVLGEGKLASAGATTLKTVNAKTVKVKTITRVSEELVAADEDSKLAIVKTIQNEQAAAIGRALDYVIFHGVNPRNGTPLNGVTALSASATAVTETTDAAADLDSLAAAVTDNYDISGIALSRKFAARLRATRVKNTGARLFPEVPLNLQAGQLDGIPAATSATVNGRVITKDTGVRAFLGDFNLIRWGLSRDITAKVLTAGDPDGAGYDLQRAGQVALSCEAIIAAAVLEPKAFAVLKTAAAGA